MERPGLGFKNFLLLISHTQSLLVAFVSVLSAEKEVAIGGVEDISPSRNSKDSHAFLSSFELKLKSLSNDDVSWN